MNHAERAAIDFVLTLRRRWADVAYPALRAEYDAAVGASPPADAKQAAPVIHGLRFYPWFAWLERNAQKALWRATGDVVAAHPPCRRLDANGPATLALDETLKLPDWYTDWDIHIQPGGVWLNDEAADVYELGAKLVMLGVNDDYTFHRAFTETVVPKRDYRRIVDFGCGFGKSTWPLKRAYPRAEVIGIDLSGPCLRLAQDKANEQGLAIAFKQADCAASGLGDGAADLVTATMVIHEMPRPAIAATIREAGRVLAPGGALRILDFRMTGDPFRDVALREHGLRNNEPFMPGAMVADVEDMAREAGFKNPRWVGFDERGSGRRDGLNWPPRSDWHFSWAVFEAERA